MAQNIFFTSLFLPNFPIQTKRVLHFLCAKKPYIPEIGPLPQLAYFLNKKPIF